MGETPEIFYKLILMLLTDKCLRLAAKKGKFADKHFELIGYLLDLVATR